MRTNSQTRKPVVLLIALLLSAVITFAHRQAIRHGHTDPITLLFRAYLIVPTVTTGQNIAAWNEASLLAPLQPSRLARDNGKLLAKVARLQQENANLRERAAEADRLDAMAKLATSLPFEARYARVIALKPSPDRDNMLILPSSEAEAKPRDVVVGPDGSLAGQVIQVTGRTSEVLLITDSLSSVGATVVPTGRPTASHAKVVVGICQGNHGPDLTLIDLPIDGDIKVGDKVVTSGLGGVFPPDIPIGHVTVVKVDTGRSLKEALVETNIDTNTLREVFLRP